MSGQFSRTALLIGHDGAQKLAESRVAVFGLGGVGGHCAEALCRAGIGAMDVIDGDTICPTNINRQIIAAHSTVGMEKAAVMRGRLLDINPDLRVLAHKLFYLPGTAESFDLSVFDYIIDAIDTVAAKIELACRAAAAGVRLISSMGAGNRLDPSAFKVADIYSTSGCPLARVVRRELRKRGVTSLKVVYSDEPPAKPVVRLGGGGNEAHDGGSEAHDGGSGFPAGKLSLRPAQPSISFVPAAAGLVIAGEVVRDLLKCRK